VKEKKKYIYIYIYTHSIKLSTKILMKIDSVIFCLAFLLKRCSVSSIIHTQKEKKKGGRKVYINIYIYILTSQKTMPKEP